MAPPPDIPPISFENYSHQSTTLVDDLLPAWSRDQSPLDTQRQSSFPTTTPFPEEIPAPLSFANVASIPSLSPKALSTTPIQSPPLPAHTAIATGTPRSPIITSEQMQNPTNDFAGELTEGLHRRETVGEDAVLNDGRIQVSFPCFSGIFSIEANVRAPLVRRSQSSSSNTSISTSRNSM